MLLTYEKGRKDKIHISVDGEYTMTVDAVFWYTLGIPNKSEIDDEELAELKSTVNSRRAYNKAIDLISRREHSRKEIIAKLSQRGYAEVAQDTADRLEEKGYLDDERFANMFSQELKTRRGFGKRRISQELYAKGIDRDIIYDVLESLEENPQEEIIDIITRKYPHCLEDEKNKNRAMNGLLRFGYSSYDIRSAMREYEERCENENTSL